MKELNVDSGVVTYSINGKCEISFNPTDNTFAEKVFDAFDALDKRQEDYKNELEKALDTKQVFEVLRNMDMEMREIINNVFGFDLCALVFSDMNVYSLANGLPVWVNLMLSIIDEIDASFSKEKKLADVRVQKYTKKYHR